MVTAALMLSVYAIVGGNEAGWTSARTVGLLGGGLGLLTAFVVREARVSQPAGAAAALRDSATSSSLRSSGCSGPPPCSPGSSWPRSTCRRCCTTTRSSVGLAFIPTSVVMAYCSLRVSDRLVMRFGIRPPLTVGLLLAAASLTLFSQAPVGGSFMVDVLPSMVLLGAGAGIAFNPVLLAAMGDVEPHESGLASGVVNTSFMFGGALGLAVLVSISTARTESLLADGASPVEALNGGLQAAGRGRRRRRPACRGRRWGLPPAEADVQPAQPRGINHEEPAPV